MALDAGSGKSKFLAQRLVYKLLKEKRKLLIVRKIQNTLKDSCFQEIKDVLSEWHILDKCNINKSELKIELSNGSMFVFKGLDDSEKIKSISGIDDIWIEEASELTLEDFTQLDLRLRTRKANSELICSYNPVSKINWVYERFHVNTSSDIRILHTTYLDNRFLPKEYSETLHKLKDTNYNYYQVYCLGQFGVLGKQVFTNYTVKDLRQIDTTKLQLRVGIDFGFTNDPTAIGLYGYDRANRTIYIIDEVYKTGLLTNQIAEIVKQKSWHRLAIVADSAEPRTIRELQILGLNIKGAKKGKDSIMQGITWLQQQNIVIDKECKNSINEFNNYTFQKDKNSGLYINKPIDAYCHQIDNLRYAVEIFSLSGKKTNVNLKSRLGL